MSFKGRSPFRKKWPLAPSVIDYIANRLCISQADACLMLQEKMREGDIGAQGPLKSANADLIEKEFWRFALPDANGYALNLSSLKQLHWFEVSAEDVLSIWPPERALGTAKSGRSKKIHFETLEAAFRLECEEKGNPEDEGPKGWQRQADVAKWVLSFASDKEIEISDSTAKKYATDLMERLGWE